MPVSSQRERLRVCNGETHPRAKRSEIGRTEEQVRRKFKAGGGKEVWDAV